MANWGPQAVPPQVLSMPSSVLSQKFDKQVYLMRARFSEPRQGRHRVAQGVSPGWGGPRPVPRLRDTPLPPGRERGRG